MTTLLVRRTLPPAIAASVLLAVAGWRLPAAGRSLLHRPAREGQAIRAVPAGKTRIAARRAMPPPAVRPRRTTRSANGVGTAALGTVGRRRRGCAAGRRVPQPPAPAPRSVPAPVSRSAASPVPTTPTDRSTCSSIVSTAPTRSAWSPTAISFRCRRAVRSPIPTPVRVWRSFRGRPNVRRRASATDGF